MSETFWVHCRCYEEKTYEIGNLEQSTLELGDTKDGLKMGIKNIKELESVLVDG
jgi:hypothetical protein